MRTSVGERGNEGGDVDTWRTVERPVVSSVDGGSVASEGSAGGDDSKDPWELRERLWTTRNFGS